MAKKFLELETLDKTHFAIIELEYISAGSFAEVFRRDNQVFLFVNPKDKSRFLLSQIENEHLPKNTYLGQCLLSGSKVDVYTAPFYRKADDNRTAVLLDKYFRNYGSQASKYDLKLYVENMLLYFAKKSIDQSILDCIKAVWDIVKDYDYILEFPLWNLCQDDNGTLILLDIAYVP